MRAGFLHFDGFGGKGCGGGAANSVILRSFTYCSLRSLHEKLPRVGSRI